MVNEIKVASRHTCIDNFFALESEKESKNDKRMFFWGYLRIFNAAVDP